MGKSIDTDDVKPGQFVRAEFTTFVLPGDPHTVWIARRGMTPILAHSLGSAVELLTEEEAVFAFGWCP